MKLDARFAAALLFVMAPPGLAAEVATDQRQVAVGYERLEALALRIADAAEDEDPARADQIRVAVGEARSLGLAERFQSVVTLLEGERFAAARRDQTELAAQLEELLRLVMADPNAAKLEEEQRRLGRLRREVRAALREQRALRTRHERGESEGLPERQAELADRVERLQEPAEESDRIAGREASAESPTEPVERAEGEPAEGKPADKSLGGRVKSGVQAMRSAGQKLAEGSPAGEDQKLAQRELEAVQREIEERLTLLREEEQQRRLATLAERFRRMHEAEVGLVADTQKLAEAPPAGDDSRTAQLAVRQLATRQADIRSTGGDALRVVRADGTSRVFDDALTQLVGDLRAAESRLRDGHADSTAVALEQSAVEALAELVAAVDEALDELDEKRAPQPGASPSQGDTGESALVSKIAELRMLRAIQARVLRQTKVWRQAADSGEASPAEVAEHLGELAVEQRRLAEAAAGVDR